MTKANRQLLLVRSGSWYATRGTLELYERDANGPWVRAGAATPVSLGRHGMAWGRGIHQAPKSGPIKREGDGKSPAGAFALERAFGVADALPQGAADFPYFQASRTSYCVEEKRSRFYNQIIDSTVTGRTSWEKWSELRRADGLFDWAVVVTQNAPETLAGAGSCVFLHVWRGFGRPTAGCTAMAHERLETVLRWLDRRAAPVMVQLPEKVYAELRADWGLP